MIHEPSCKRARDVRLTHSTATGRTQTEAAHTKAHRDTPSKYRHRALRTQRIAQQWAQIEQHRAHTSYSRNERSNTSTRRAIKPARARSCAQTSRHREAKRPIRHQTSNHTVPFISQSTHRISRSSTRSSSSQPHRHLRVLLTKPTRPTSCRPRCSRGSREHRQYSLEPGGGTSSG